MKTTTESKPESRSAYTPSAGAFRAGRNISAKFRTALPGLPESNAYTLAAIIDAETAAPALYEALVECVQSMEICTSAKFGCLPKARAALALVKGGQ